MDAYALGIERAMKRLFGSLIDRDRRRYAAFEATKLGHGGVEHIARLCECDPKTVRLGQAELDGTDDLDTGRVRKKGAGGSGGSSSIPRSPRTSRRSSKTTRRANPCGATSSGPTCRGGRSPSGWASSGRR